MKHSKYFYIAFLLLVTSSGWSSDALINAATRGNLAEVRRLTVSRKAASYATPRGWTALHAASLRGRADVVAYLVNKYPYLATNQDLFQNTPILCAASMGHLSCVKILANKSPKTIDIPNCDGFTPLHIAGNNGYAHVVKYLLRRGADVNGRVPGSESTPLHTAAYQQNYAVVRLLIRHGARITNIDARWATTPLHEAAGGGNVRLLNMLLAGVKTPDLPDRDGFTPLHASALVGKLGTTRALVNAGASVNIKCKEGLTPIDMARIGGEAKIIAYFERIKPVKYIKPTPDKKPVEKTNSLIVAVKPKRAKKKKIEKTETVRPSLIVTKTVTTNAVVAKKTTKQVELTFTKKEVVKPKRILTGLHEAAYHGYVSVMSYLLSARRSINGKDRYGWTPLHYAAEGGQLKAVMFLLSKKARIDICTPEGKLATDIARDNGHETLAQIIKNASIK